MLQKIKRYYEKNKAYCTGGILLVLLLTGLSIFTFHNSFLYRTEIARIVQIREEASHMEYGPEDKEEQYFHQNITAVLENGREKGTTVSLENDYSQSGVYDVRYQQGDRVLVARQRTPEGGELLQIQSLKRDGYLVLLFSVFLAALYFISRKKGLLSFLGVVINIVFYILMLFGYVTGLPMFWVCVICLLFFSSVSLLIISGCQRKTVAAIVCTMAGTVAQMLIAIVVLKVTRYDGIMMETLPFVVNEYEYERLFLTQLMISGLGAIMDISVTISSSVAELLSHNPDISREALFQSGRNIGKDIMGTMVNVLLFTYLCGCIPILLLMMRNGVSFAQYIHNFAGLEMVRFLTGAIGIVGTIPLGVFLSQAILMGRRNECAS